MRRKTILQTYPDIIADVRYNSATLWSKIDQSAGPKGCWTYTGPKHRQGYGMIGGYRIATEKKLMMTVHRLMLKIKTNSDLTGSDAVHTCNNPYTCVNPDHMIVGTAKKIHEIRYQRSGPRPGRPKGWSLTRPRNHKYKYGVDVIMQVYRNEIDVNAFATMFNIPMNKARHIYKTIQNGTAYKWIKDYKDSQ